MVVEEQVSAPRKDLEVVVAQPRPPAEEARRPGRDRPVLRARDEQKRRGRRRRLGVEAEHAGDAAGGELPCRRRVGARRHVVLDGRIARKRLEIVDELGEWIALAAVAADPSGPEPKRCELARIDEVVRDGEVWLQPAQETEDGQQAAQARAHEHDGQSPSRGRLVDRCRGRGEGLVDGAISPLAVGGAVPRTVDGEHVVAAAREQSGHQEVDAGVSAASRLEDDGRSRLGSLVHVQVHALAADVEPGVLDRVDDASDLAGPPANAVNRGLDSTISSTGSPYSLCCVSSLAPLRDGGSESGRSARRTSPQVEDRLRTPHTLRSGLERDCWGRVTF